MKGWGIQEINPRLQRHVKNRLQAIEKGVGLDWATAEVSGLFLRFSEQSR
jgi:2-oxoglutarate dehydrogenase complex dehydrogenase (E1) component-like enzyme